MEKTYVFGEDRYGSGLLGLLAPFMQQRGVDPNVLLALNNRDNNGWGDGNSFIWILFLLILFGGWGNGFGGFGNGVGNGFGANALGTGYLSNQLNNDLGRDLLMQAINGNGDAIRQLSSTLQCSIGDIQQAINGLNTQILQVGNQVGMSSMQVINAIQAGNCQIAGQLASCCCEIKTAIERQGYENRLATLQQTSDLKDDLGDKFTALTAKIDAQTQIINDNFCGLEKRELQREINALRDEKAALQASALSQTQTSNIVNAVRPCPIPAYITCNPYDSNGFYSGYYGGSGCGNC